jgi:hypothetical protein
MSQTDAIVLVDALRTGGPFQAAASETGLAVIGAFTFGEAAAADLLESSATNLARGWAACYFALSPERLVEEFEREGFRVRAVVPATEPGVTCADRLAALLKLRGNDPELIAARRDKAAMRAAVARAGLRSPAFARVEALDDALRFAREHGFPLMLKTPSGASMNNVFRCERECDISPALTTILGTANLFGQSATHAVIETFLDGPEYAVNMFNDGSRIHVTDIWKYERRDTAHARNLYYAAIMQSTETPLGRQLADYAAAVTRAVGIRFGPAHVEVKLTPEPTMIEVGARLFGIEAPRRMVEGSNFHPYRGTVDVFLNGTTAMPDPVRYHEFQAHAFCITEASGTIVRVDGLEEIAALPSFRTWTVKAKVGKSIRPTVDMETHPLLVWLAHPEREVVLRDLETVHRVHRIHATPDPVEPP